MYCLSKHNNRQDSRPHGPTRSAMDARLASPGEALNRSGPWSKQASLLTESCECLLYVFLRGQRAMTISRVSGLGLGLGFGL